MVRRSTHIAGQKSSTNFLSLGVQHTTVLVEVTFFFCRKSLKSSGQIHDFMNRWSIFHGWYINSEAKRDIYIILYNLVQPFEFYGFTYEDIKKTFGL